MYESISKNNELENEMTLDMSYFWYSDIVTHPKCTYHFIHLQPSRQRIPIPLGICSLGSYRPKEGQRHCSYCISPGKTYCQGW